MVYFNEQREAEGGGGDTAGCRREYDYVAHWAKKRRLAVNGLLPPRGDKIYMVTPTALLDAVVKTLIHEQGDVIVTPWFSDAEPLGIKDGRFFVAVSNDILRDTLNRRFSDRVSEICTRLVGRDIQPVFLSDEETIRWRSENDEGGIYSNYTFERFIVGNSNKFAHAAAYAVAREPAANYNPLFIYGQSGLGKTHLLYAIASEIRQTRPDYNIVYRKGDDFTNELVESLRMKTMFEFRETYRKADLLLVDDIQFIAGKEQTQEEFFHTFNTLYESRKQVVLTSDRPPKEIALLTERLRSRFEAGLLADVQPPDLETRMALITEKSQLLGLKLSTGVIQYIAESITNNVRELEGAVKKIFALYDLMKRDVDIEMAKEALRDIYKVRPGLNPTPELILEEVSSFFGIPVERIKGGSRTADVVFPRQVSTYLMRELTDLSLPDIGKFMNGQHHSTVLHAIDRVNREMEKRDEIRATIKDLKSNIQSR